MHKQNVITDELYERLTPRYIEFLDTKMSGLRNTPVSSIARLVMPRELGIGINDDSKASKIERAMYQRPATAAQMRRERICLAINRERVNGHIKVLPLKSFVCYLPHIERDEEHQNIDSMLALAVTVGNVPAWVSLTTFYMKTIVDGEERIWRDSVGEEVQVGEMALSPSAFMVGRPTILTGGSVSNTYFPDASNAFGWTPLTDYDPAHLATATGYSSGQLIAMGV